jgi:hypothetical protein
MFPRLLSLLAVLLCFTIPLEARVVRVEVSSRTDVLNGQQFGEAGAYERIVGRVYFSVAVANLHNRRIVDLDKAEDLKDGEVAFSSDFIAVRPSDEKKGSGSMLLEIPNRGRGRIIGLVDGGDWDLSKDLGDGWLLRNGYTIVTLGWQWDATGPNAVRLYAPVAKALTGLRRGDLMPWQPMQVIPLGHLILGMIGGAEYPVAAPDDSRNALSVRDSPTAKRAFVPRSQWQFAHIVDGKLQPSDRHIYLKRGFQAGKIYEYVYVVENPVIAGLGFAAVRDFASYAKHSSDSITAAVRVYGEGISQNGRFLRDFLYQGFNADEEGRIALDGVLAHVAGAGRGSFNYRFAQPSRDAQPTSSVFFPTDVFPFTDLPQIDRVTGAKGGLLDAAIAQKAVPKIFYSNTSYEYWGRAAALIHITPDGKRDARLPPDVRIYHLTGLQHFSRSFPPAMGTEDLRGQSPQSPLPVNFFWRAMIANMDAWVRNGTAPPESGYPRIANGTLVPLSRFKFPAIPGANKPHEANRAYRLDFGPKRRDGFLSLQPPKVGEAFPVLVPQVDADGNELSGVRQPQITVPLATYTGWNLRDPAIGAPDQRVSFLGSYLPFAKTAAEREKSGDPRESIAERYLDREDYLNRYSGAVDELVKQRWILAEDRRALLKRGEQEWDYATQ